MKRLYIDPGTQYGASRCCEIFKLCTHSVKCAILLMFNLSTCFCERVSPHCQTVLTSMLLKNLLQQFQINTTQTVISFCCV